jgi:hypothetical protein
MDANHQHPWPYNTYSIRQNAQNCYEIFIEFNNWSWNTNVLKAFYPQSSKNLCNEYFIWIQDFSFDFFFIYFQHSMFKTCHGSVVHRDKCILAIWKGQGQSYVVVKSLKLMLIKVVRIICFKWPMNVDAFFLDVNVHISKL